MAHFNDWIPAREQDLVDLSVRWTETLDVPDNQAAYGWNENDCAYVTSTIATFLTARGVYEQVNSTENRIVKDERKVSTTAGMREFARSSIRFNRKVGDEVRVYLGVRIIDNSRTSIHIPHAQCTGRVTNPGIHLVEIDLEGYAILTADQRANYGVRIYWGILPFGEITIDMVAGPKHYLAKIPTSGDVLGNSIFTRKQKHVFDFDGDSGSRVFFCCRFENSKGECGPFGPIISAIIT